MLSILQAQALGQPVLPGRWGCHSPHGWPEAVPRPALQPPSPQHLPAWFRHSLSLALTLTPTGKNQAFLCIH